MEQKGGEGVNLPFLLELGRPPSPTLRYQCSQLSGLQTESHHWLPHFSSLQMSRMGLLSLYNHMINFCNESISLSLNIYLLLVWFLWKTLIAKIFPTTTTSMLLNYAYIGVYPCILIYSLSITYRYNHN